MARPTTIVYIAASLDGFISRDDGSFDWLAPFEDPTAFERFEAFLANVNAILMGRNTFLQVVEFPKWPYHDVPVYVLSSSLHTLPKASPKTAILRNLAPQQLLSELESEGIQRIYVDGGITIQKFLAEDLIDEMTITRVPILLGTGRTLFGTVPDDLHFQHISTEAFPSGLVQSKYVRKP